MGFVMNDYKAEKQILLFPITPVDPECFMAI